MERSTEFLKSTACLLVDEADAVEVTRKTDDMGVLLTLKVGKGDMGKILGKQGATANSIRTLLRAIGAKDKEAVHLRIHDPERDGEFVR